MNARQKKFNGCYKIFDPSTHVCIKNATAGEALMILERIRYGNQIQEDLRQAAVTDLQRAIGDILLETI